MQPAVIGNVKNHNTAVSPPAYEAGGDRVADPARVRVFSSGGGVQSTGAAVLSARGEIDYRTHVFCNVGDDSEAPETLAYVAEHLKPYAERHGLEWVELRKHRRDGTPETILERINRSKRSIPIPVRMSRNGAPGRRSCTVDFKILLVARYLKQVGATVASPATLGIGISVDEFHRSRTDSGFGWIERDEPLLALKLTRDDCLRIVREAGLPDPPRSACWFCPMRSAKGWAEMRVTKPERFAAVVGIERDMQARRAALGKDPVYFHSRLKPLEMATADGYQPALGLDEEEGGCESGFCWS